MKGRLRSISKNINGSGSTPFLMIPFILSYSASNDLFSVTPARYSHKEIVDSFIQLSVGAGYILGNARVRISDPWEKSAPRKISEILILVCNIQKLHFRVGWGSG